MSPVRQIQLLQSARTSSILRTQKIGVDAKMSSWDWLDFGAKKGSTPDLSLSYGLSVMSVFECGWYQIQAPCNTGTSDETDCFWI